MALPPRSCSSGEPVCPWPNIHRDVGISGSIGTQGRQGWHQLDGRPAGALDTLTHGTVRKVFFDFGLEHTGTWASIE